MSFVSAISRLLAASSACLLLAACSKTVKWEEEVTLHTGETIWIQRLDAFERSSEPGNPLKPAWWPKKRAYEFTWQGQSYKYERDAKDSLGAFIIYPLVAERTIVIVDGTRDCATPGYGEFRWINGRWQLQQHVSMVLIGQPRNLMGYYSASDGDIPARADEEYKRKSRFDLPQRGGEEKLLLASRIAVDCSGKK